MRLLSCLLALLFLCQGALAQSKPEITVVAVAGKAEVKKVGGSWEALKKDATFDLKDFPAFRTYDSAEVSLQLPDESTVTLSPQTHLLLSENEKRELSLAYGLISVVSSGKSRVGLQIRMLGGLIRCPDGRISVGVSPLGRSYIFVESNFVYLYDEETELLSQKKVGEANYEALLANKEQAPIPKIEATQIDEGEAFQFDLSATTPIELPADKASTKGLQSLLQSDASTWDKAVPAMLAERLKATQKDLSSVEALLKNNAELKAKNLSRIEELKTARAASDQAGIERSQSLIAAQSRVLLTSKRLTHLLSLEAQLQLEALALIGQQSPKNSAAQKALTKNAATLTALTTTSSTLASSVAGLRPRTRASFPSPTSLPKAKPTAE